MRRVARVEEEVGRRVLDVVPVGRDHALVVQRPPLAVRVADVADVDAVISNGPGLRLALLGPHINYHLGGGTGGYRHYLEHLGPTQETRWKTLGDPFLTAEVKELLITGIEDQNIKVDDLISKRDKGLVEILKIKKENKL